MPMPIVVLSPFNVVNFPEGGGHFWVYMQYALGLRQLGCDVYWLECFHSRGDEASDQALLAPFRARMERFGLGGKLILYPMPGPGGEPGLPREFAGMSALEAESIFADADLLLNFHYAISPALLARFRRTALVDIDPGLLQFWISRNQLSVPRHDCYFTIGAGIREPQWIHIRPAVSLEHWPVSFDAGCEAFTTVSIWDSSDWVVDGNEEYENTK